ncbi:MAG: permease prefix domain 1-containing protein, partial [Bryobacteraceae bacterium]
MSWLKRLRGTAQQRKLEREIEAELRSHLEMRADDQMEAGMEESDARRDAQKRFGNTTLLPGLGLGRLPGDIAVHRRGFDLY